MLTNADITLYHLAEDEESYTRTVYEGVSLHRSTKAVATHNGVLYEGLYRIRIPTSDAVPVAVGDYVLIGISTANTPDKSKCHSVVGLSDNRRGTEPHWKVECK